MITVRVKLTFPESLVRTPVLARMVPRVRRRAQHPAGERRGALGVDHLRAGGRRRPHRRGRAWLRTEGIGVDLLGDVLES